MEKLRKQTLKLEPWWTLVFVPIWQEFIFRYLPYQFVFLPTGRFWEIGVLTSLVFASIHWYFGWKFVVCAFIAGFLQWLVMVHYGLLAAILLHSVLNLIDLRFGIRRRGNSH